MTALCCVLKATVPLTTCSKPMDSYPPPAGMGFKPQRSQDGAPALAICATGFCPQVACDANLPNSVGGPEKCLYGLGRFPWMSSPMDGRLFHPLRSQLQTLFCRAAIQRGLASGLQLGLAPFGSRSSLIAGRTILHSAANQMQRTFQGLRHRRRCVSGSSQARPESRCTITGGVWLHRFSPEAGSSAACGNWAQWLALQKQARDQPGLYYPGHADVAEFSLPLKVERQKGKGRASSSCLLYLCDGHRTRFFWEQAAIGSWQGISTCLLRRRG